MNWFVHCRSLREIYSNRLTGPLPLELTNLFQLQDLYALNRIVLLDNSFGLLSFDDALILSLSFSQLPRPESVHWHPPTWARQPHKAHPFVRSIVLVDKLLAGLLVIYVMMIYQWLFLSIAESSHSHIQVLIRLSAQWHDPTWARQTHPAPVFVRSNISPFSRQN